RPSSLRIDLPNPFSRANTKSGGDASIRAPISFGKKSHVDGDLGTAYTFTMLDSSKNRSKLTTPVQSPVGSDRAGADGLSESLAASTFPGAGSGAGYSAPAMGAD